MKTPTLALAAALLALAPAAQAQSTFVSVKVTRDYTLGPRAGERTTLTVTANGAVSLELRLAGATCSTTTRATVDELRAVRAAFRAARTSSLPKTIVDLSELKAVASQRLEALLPSGKRTSCASDLGRYGSFRPRLAPLVQALDAVAARLEPVLRAPFRSITVTTRATGGPTPDATSVVALQADRSARLERRLPGEGPRTAEGQATAVELERVVAALRDARLSTVPDGFILDPHELHTLSRVELRVVLQDGTTRTISAKRGLYGPHRLAPLVDAVEALARRLATTGLTGAVGD